MALQTQSTYPSEIVKFMVDQNYCVEKHVVTDGQTLEIGDICETASSKKIIVATAGNADSICLEAASPSGADGEALFLMRGPAIVIKGELDYNSVTEATADAALEALGILARAAATTNDVTQTS